METISRIILQGIDNTGPASKSAKANMASLADQTTVSAKQAAAAMRMVPAQMTDIVTQLAGGQSPLLVLIQQGGQLKDMFGGTGNAAKAMGNYLLGLASPATIAAAGLAAVGAAAYVGSKESFEFNKQLALTGGYAGLSASQLMAMSARLSEANGTQHETASVLAAIVATGQVAAGQFEVIGSAAMAMSDATGRSVKEIVAEFIELGKEPAAASAKLNEQYHYLTLSTYEQIKALEEQGKKTEAAALAQRTYAGAMKTAADQVLGQLGLLERGWKSLTDGAKKAWDAMLNVGRGQTTGEQLAALEKSLADREQRGPLNSTSTASFEKGNAALRQKIEEQREALRMENRAANSRGDNARIQAEGIAAQQEVSKLEDQAKGLTLVNKKLDEYHQRLDAIRKADPNSASLDPATIKRMEAQIRKSGMGGAPKGNENAINTDLVDLKGDMQQVERAVKASIEAIKTDYDVGLLGTREYVDKEFAIRQDGLQKQLAIARDLEEVASGKKNTVAAQRYQNEIEKIQDEISAGTAKHANDVTRYDANVKRATSEYLASLTAEYNVRQQAISDIIAGASLGAVAQEQLQRMTNLTREFNKRKEELRKASEKPEAKGGISRETYDKELADLQSYYDRRVAQEKDFNAKDRANRSDPNVGAAKAFNDYKEQAADVAGQTQRQWAGLYSNLEDAAVGWATRSKVSIASVGQAFYAELVRMQIRAAASSVYTAISGGLGLAGLFGGGSSIAAAGASDTSSIYSLASGASGLGLKFKANAKGDIYSTGGLHEYVNSIVSRPTIFPFAKGGALGLMGEAGPEAIMPLSRGPDGSLGVKTVAGSGSQQPFVYAPVAHIAVDARADRAAVIGDVQQLLAQNNKQQLENLKRLGVIPA